MKRSIFNKLSISPTCLLRATAYSTRGMLREDAVEYSHSPTCLLQLSQWQEVRVSDKSFSPLGVKSIIDAAFGDL